MTETGSDVELSSGLNPEEASARSRLPWLPLGGLMACFIVVAVAALTLRAVRADQTFSDQDFYVAASVAMVTPTAVEVPPATRARLRAALDEWAAATNDRDFERQMSFYAPRLKTYYGRENVPSAEVLTHRRRVFARASAFQPRPDAPEMTLNPDGTATVRLRKRPDVTQELTWARTDSGWRIVGER
jgi:hypothetical protein